jgi:hypothetical protein
MAQHIKYAVPFQCVDKRVPESPFLNPFYDLFSQTPLLISAPGFALIKEQLMPQYRK